MSTFSSYHNTATVIQYNQPFYFARFTERKKISKKSIFVLAFERTKIAFFAGKETRLMLDMDMVQFHTEKSTDRRIVEPVSAWSIRFESTGVCSIG